jgi:hypothetical protein
MMIGHIQNSTRTLGAPAGWDKDKDGPCGGLPIRDEETTAGMGMTSAWFPTDDEIKRLKLGAPVHLTLLGGVHPPVAMSVGAADELGRSATKPRK